MQIVCIRSSWCHCRPHRLLPHLNPDWFYLSGSVLPRLSWKRSCYTGVVVAAAAAVAVVVVTYLLIPPRALILLLKLDHSSHHCSVLFFNRPRSKAWTHFVHLSLSSVVLINSSTGSPVHVLMLSIQAVHGLPRLCAPGIVPCIISFSRQLPCFLMSSLQLTICFKSSKSVQIDLCMLMSLSIHLHGLHLDC